MFVRKVSMRLKGDSAAEFTRKMEQEIIPLLRQQSGFLDEMTLRIAQSGKEVYAFQLLGKQRGCRKLRKSQLWTCYRAARRGNRRRAAYSHLYGGELHISQDGRSRCRRILRSPYPDFDKWRSR